MVNTDECLDEMLRIAGSFYLRDGSVSTNIALEDVLKLGDLVEALNGALSMGGLLPDRWSAEAVQRNRLERERLQREGTRF